VCYCFKLTCNLLLPPYTHVHTHTTCITHPHTHCTHTAHTHTTYRAHQQPLPWQPTTNGTPLCLALCWGRAQKKMSNLSKEREVSCNPLSPKSTGAYLASFPGRRSNGLATSASSNCYFHCLKVGSTIQISERSHMTTVKPQLHNALNRHSHAHSTSIAITLV